MRWKNEWMNGQGGNASDGTVSLAPKILLKFHSSRGKDGLGFLVLNLIQQIEGGNLQL